MEEQAGGSQGLARGRARGRGRAVISFPPGQQQEVKSSSSSTGSSSSRDRDSPTAAAQAAAQALAEIQSRSGLQFIPRDNFKSRPETLDSKTGTTGSPIALIANYYSLNMDSTWRIFKHHVSFPDEIDHKPLRKRLIKDIASQIGPNNFDGSTLISLRQIMQPNEKEKQFVSLHPGTQEKIVIRIIAVGTLTPADPMIFQFFNNIVRKCLGMLNLTEIRRNYFEPDLKIPFSDFRIELWPGLVTSLRRHENSSLLCVDVTHKVLRQDNIYDEIQHIKNDRNTRDFEQTVKSELIGRICMTMYNNKTYPIDDVIFEKSPMDTFTLKNGTITTFMDYYQKSYQATIKEKNQPLLLSNPRGRDVHGGQKAALLIPELCKLTGLTEKMRSDFNLMKMMDQYLQMVPSTRTKRIGEFRKKLQKKELKEELDNWGLSFSKDLVELKGRKLPLEPIMFAKDQVFNPSQQNDWSRAFQDKKLLYEVVHLNDWVVLVSGRALNNARQLVQTMIRVGQPIGFQIKNPLNFIELRNTSPHGYSREVEETIKKYNQRLQLVFVVLPNNKIEAYAAVKKVCYVNFGISSQCFVERTMAKNPTNMSVATKVVVQMAAKLGGIPWLIKVPMKNIMIVGFDVHHPAGSGTTWGAMVSTTSSCGRFFSTISKHGNQEELSQNMKDNFTKCLDGYYKALGTVPDRIFFYRDGVGEGQLFDVFNKEITDIQFAIEKYYQIHKKAHPKFAFIVVTKRINTKFFINDRGNMDNPPPGTIVDDVITLPERYDFYMVAQAGRKGTVTPTSYNVLFDQSGLSPDKIHVFTYKMTHLYYNWTGTLAVPAVCQYAHKLAFLVGKATGTASSPNLENLLYYL